MFWRMSNVSAVSPVFVVVGCYGMNYKLPTMYNLRVNLLRRQVKNIDEMKKMHEEQWRLGGCTLMSDDWTDQRQRSVINFLVNSPVGTFYLHSIEASSEEKTAQFIADGLENAMTIIGPENVVQVDAILSKGNYTLDELLDEDEIIQECKALNYRLINFLRKRTQVEQLLRYIVEGHVDTEQKYTFKFPFIACEIITCEVDIIPQSLVEDEELMALLFSFLKYDHLHSTLLAGYFCKVVSCLMLRKTVHFMRFVQAHEGIFQQLVDLIGITSIMEVLIRLIGANEQFFSIYMDSLHWVGETNVLEMIVDKFSSSDSPEVHANVAETLCAITRCSPQVLAEKIFSTSFVGRLLCHALKDSRPRSVLVYSLTVCISLLDPKRYASTSYRSFGVTHKSVVNASSEIVDGMLENLGDLMKLLDISSALVLPTTYGSLQPPLGNHRLKIIELVSVLLTIGNEDAEKELVRLGTIEHILDLFFEYPFNNFLHHHVECIIFSCLESRRMLLTEHLFQDCELVGKILEAEKSFTLSSEPNKVTMLAEGSLPPRIGNIGHITRISNKLVQLANINSIIKIHLMENSEWAEWYTSELLKRNANESIFQWICGRPTNLEDRNIDSDDECNNRTFENAIFLCGGYNHFENEEVRRSVEKHDKGRMPLDQDDEDYFDDSAQVFSSLHLGDDHERTSVITDPYWPTFQDNQVTECGSRSFFSSPPNSDEDDNVIIDENNGQAASSRLDELEDDSLEAKSSLETNFSLDDDLLG